MIVSPNQARALPNSAAPAVFIYVYGDHVQRPATDSLHETQVERITPSLVLHGDRGG